MFDSRASEIHSSVEETKIQLFNEFKKQEIAEFRLFILTNTELSVPTSITCFMFGAFLKYKISFFTKEKIKDPDIVKRIY